MFKLSVIVLMLLAASSVCYNYPNNYLISTNLCKIPDLSVTIPSDHPNSPEYQPVHCSNSSQILTSYVTKQGEKYILRVKKVTNDDKNWIEEYDCCYSYISRSGSGELPDKGVNVTTCIPFESVELLKDTVLVRCREKNTESNYKAFFHNYIYENVHQIIKLDEKLKDKSKKLTETLENERAISVLFIVLDGVSRLNFIRTMPLTHKFVTEEGFYEFKGYNKIADNTYPNFMAWLTGLGKNEIYSVCKPTEIDGLMNCPMLWYRYRDLGYITAYAEDWAELNTFNYNKKGFKDPPTDFYFKPYFDAVASLDVQYVDTMPYCSGPEIEGQRLLNLAADFARITKHLPSFGVFWANTFSHNNRNTTRRMDKNLQEMFQTLKEDGTLEDRIVILLSDHGNRYGDLIATGRGFFEERLPMNYIYLPTWFKTKYPSESKIFEANTRKLTSTFDLYMTLQHLLKLSGVNSTLESSKACATCKSLFEKLPEDRSCADAGITEEWCSCIGAIHKDKNTTPEDQTFLWNFIESQFAKIEKEEDLRKGYVQSIEEVLKSEPKFIHSLITKYYHLVRFTTYLNETYQIIFLTPTYKLHNPEVIGIRKKYP